MTPSNAFALGFFTLLGCIVTYIVIYVLIAPFRYRFTNHPPTTNAHGTNTPFGTACMFGHTIWFALIVIGFSTGLGYLVGVFL